MARVDVVLWTIGFLVLSGCSSAKQATLPEGEGVADVDVVYRTVATGAIQGVVVDDEYRPLQRATVVLTSHEAKLQTGQDGTFVIQNVPVGRHTLLVTRDGYAQTVAKANVTEGVSTVLEIVLQRIVVSRASYETIPHTALHHVGAGDVDQLGQFVGEDALCEACKLSITARAPPRALLVEVEGKHTTPNPLGDAEYVRLVNQTNGTAIVQGNLRLPVRLEVNATRLGGAHQFDLWLLCDAAWVCQEERRQAYVTLFYYQDIPDGFTARPPS